MSPRLFARAQPLLVVLGLGCGDESLGVQDATTQDASTSSTGGRFEDTSDTSLDDTSSTGSALPPSEYTVRGTLSGLAPSTQVGLAFEDASELTLVENGSFESLVSAPEGPTYDIAIVAQPEGQACLVDTPGAQADNGDLNNVEIACERDFDGDGIGDSMDEDDDGDGWSDDDELRCGDGDPLDADVTPLDNDGDGICDALDTCRLDDTDQCEMSSPFRDCFDISRAAEFVTPSGAYWVQPNEDASPMQVYCEMTVDGGGWTLVIHQDDSDTWADWNHNFDLNAQSGTYVAEPLSAGNFYLPHADFVGEPSAAEDAPASDYADESQYLLASGDLADWLIARPSTLRLDARGDALALPAYSNAPQRVELDSSEPAQLDPIEYRWFFRDENGEDPWVSLGDHPIEEASTSVMLYGENGAALHTERGKERSGMNVFVRRERPPEQMLGFDESRCWFEASLVPSPDPQRGPEVNFDAQGCLAPPDGVPAAMRAGRGVATLELDGATYFAVGLPDAGGGEGRVIVYRQDSGGDLIRVQTLLPADVSAISSFRAFGHALSMATAPEDDTSEALLVVGAPGTATDDGGFAVFFLETGMDAFQYFTSYEPVTVAGSRMGETVFTDGQLAVAGAPALAETAGHAGFLNLQTISASVVAFPSVPSPTIGQLGPNAQCGAAVLVTRSPRRILVGCPGSDQIEEVDPSALTHSPSRFVPRPTSLDVFFEGQRVPSRFGASLTELTLPSGESVALIGSPERSVIEDDAPVPVGTMVFARDTPVGPTTVYRVSGAIESPAGPAGPLGFSTEMTASYPFVAVFSGP